MLLGGVAPVVPSLDTDTSFCFTTCRPCAQAQETHASTTATTNSTQQLHKTHQIISTHMNVRGRPQGFPSGCLITAGCPATNLLSSLAKHHRPLPRQHTVTHHSSTATHNSTAHTTANPPRTRLSHARASNNCKYTS
jgi:hypothetical protein